MNEFFQDHPDAFQVGGSYGFRYDHRERRRYQLDATIEHKLWKWPWHRDDVKLKSEAVFRHYREPQAGELSPRWSVYWSERLDFPIVRRLALAPFIERYYLSAKGVPGTFRLERYGFKIALPVYARLGRGWFVR